MKNIFVINDKVCIFAPLKTEDPWCNGSTPDFGSVCRGSNPCGSTNCISNQSITIMHPLKYPQIVLRVLFLIEKINTTFVNKKAVFLIGYCFCLIVQKKKSILS